MYQHHKLKNGLNVIGVPVKGTRAITLFALLPVGSRYEIPELSGASHFVEHMLFKGTLRRPSPQDITRASDAVGAEHNAFTYKDYTGYYIKVDSHQHELAADLLSDMIFNSVFAEEEIAKEKGAIVEELRMYQDNPSMAIDILSDKLVFDKHPLGWDIGGTETTVRGISRESLWKYYREHYSPQNIVLVVAGDVDSKRLRTIEAYFDKYESIPGSRHNSSYKKNYLPFAWSKQRLNLSDRTMVEKRTVDQAQVLLNFPGVTSRDLNRYAFSILLTILGGNMSSRLFVEVREKRGLAYMIRTSASSYRETGICSIQAGLDPHRIGEAVAVIETELKKIANEPVHKQELEDAKNYLVGRLSLSMEDSSSQAEWYAKQFLFSPKMRTPEQAIQNLKKVTPAQITKMAKEYLSWPQMRLAVISPLSKEEVLEQIHSSAS